MKRGKRRKGSKGKVSKLQFTSENYAAISSACKKKKVPRVHHLHIHACIYIFDGLCEVFGAGRHDVQTLCFALE